MIPVDLLITFTFLVHEKKLPNKLYKGVIPPSKEGDPPSFIMMCQICRITALGGLCWFECNFFLVMFHINKNYFQLSFH